MFAVSSLLYFWADSTPALLALRFLHGVGFGMATTATGAIVADIVPNERRGEGLGYYAMFMNLAMVIGPFAGLTIVQYASFSWIFALCTVLSFIAIVLGVFVKIPQKAESTVKHPKFTLSSLFEKMQFLWQFLQASLLLLTQEFFPLFLFMRKSLICLKLQASFCGICRIHYYVPPIYRPLV